MEPQSRVLGGYTVIPTEDTLRQIRQAPLRVPPLEDALRAVADLHTALLDLRADTANDLHFEHGLSWSQIAQLFRDISEPGIYRAARLRRESALSPLERARRNGLAA